MSSNDLTQGSDPLSRRRLFKRAGYATTAAAIPGAVLVATTDADAAAKVAAAKVVKDPTGPTPQAPLMAYVHDRKKGTVVIMSGETQRTVQDKELVRRLTVVPKKPKRRPARRRRRKATRRDALAGV